MVSHKRFEQGVSKRADRKEDARELRERESVRYPCFDLFNYSRGLRLNAQHLLRYTNTRFCRLEEDKRQALIADFRAEDAGFLQLNNPEACIRFYKYFAAILNLYAARRKCYFLTLAPIRFCIPISEARSFDFKKKLLPWVRQMLHGFHFIGFLDIACYSNFVRDGRAGYTLSFHVHLLVRSTTRKEVDKVVAYINAKNGAFIPGCAAAHVEDVEPGTIHRLAAYMCKGPTGDYRVWAKKSEIVDEWGEVHETVAGFKQWKRKYSTPGVQLRVRSAVSHCYLDDMLVGGGSGVEKIEEIRRHARAGMPRSMRKHRLAAHSGKLPHRPLYTNDAGWTSDFTYALSKDPDRKRLDRPWKFDPLAKSIERMTS